MLPHTDTDPDAHSQNTQTHPSTHTRSPTVQYMQVHNTHTHTHTRARSLIINTHMHTATFSNAGVQARQRYTQTEQGRAARRPTTWGSKAVYAILQHHYQSSALIKIYPDLVLFFLSFFCSRIILNPKSGICNLRSHCFYQGLLYLNSHLLAVVGCTLIQDGIS